MARLHFVITIAVLFLPTFVNPCCGATVGWTDHRSAPARNFAGDPLPGVSTIGEPDLSRGALVQFWLAVGAIDDPQGALGAYETANWRIDDVLLQESHIGHGLYQSWAGVWSTRGDFPVHEDDTVYVRAYNLPKADWGAAPLSIREVGIRSDYGVVSSIVGNIRNPQTLYFDSLRTIPWTDVPPPAALLMLSASPARISNGGGSSSIIRATFQGSNWLGEGQSVLLDLSDVGGESSVPMHDDGGGGDQQAGDNIFSYRLSVDDPSIQGKRFLTARAIDVFGNTHTASVDIEITAAVPPPMGGSMSVGRLVVEADTLVQQSGNIYAASGHCVINGFLHFLGELTLNQSTLVLKGNGELRVSAGPLGDIVLYDGEFTFDGGEAITNLMNSAFSVLEVVGLKVHIKSIELIESGVRIRGTLSLPQDWGGAKADFGSQGQYLDITDSGIRFSGRIDIPDLEIGGWGMSDAYLEFDPDNDRFEGTGTLLVPFGFDIEAGAELTGGQLNRIGVGVDGLNKPILWTPPPAPVPIVYLQGIYGELDELAPGPPPWVFRLGRYDDQGFLTGGITLTVGPEIDSHFALKGAGAMEIDSAGRFTGSADLFVWSDDYRVARAELIIDKRYGVYVGAWAKWRFEALGVDAFGIDASGAMMMDLQNTFRGRLDGTLSVTWPWEIDLASGHAFLKIAEDDFDDVPDQYLVAWSKIGPLKVSAQYDFATGELDTPANMDLVEEIVFPEALSGMVVRPLGASETEVLSANIVQPGQYVFVVRTTQDTSGLSIRKPDGTSIYPGDVGESFQSQAGKGAFFLQAVLQAELGTWRIMAAEGFGLAGVEAEILKVRPEGEVGGCTVGGGIGASRVAPTAPLIPITWQDGDPAEGTITLLYSSDGTYEDGNTIVAGIRAADPTNSHTWNTEGVPAGTYYIVVVLEQNGMPPVSTCSVDTITITDVSTPDAPTELAAWAIPGGAYLRWSPSTSPNVASYVAYYTDDAAGPKYTSSKVVGNAIDAELRPLMSGLTYRLAVSAVDAVGRESSLSDPVTLLVQTSPPNSAPVFTSIPVAQTTEFAVYTYAVQAQDPDSQPISYSLSAGPSSMTVDPQSGMVVWQPRTSDVGEHIITVAARDCAGTVNLQEFVLTVLADNDRDGIPNDVDPDDDNDGLTDEEESVLGTSPLVADSDGDGMDDGDEVVAGTSPLDQASFFAVVNVIQEAEQIRVEWTSIPGREYAVHDSEDLVNWTLLEVVVASANTSTFVSVGSDVGPVRFYRIEVLPLP